MVISHPTEDMESNGKLRTPISLRFCDTDMIGHINNVSFGAFAESGRIALFRAYDWKGSDLILVRLAMDYKAQVQLEDPLVVESWVERIGNSSIQINQQMLVESKVVTEVESVVVTFDYAENRPHRVSDALRRVIQSVDLGMHTS